MAEPIFFATAAAFRRWLEEHHQSADELLVGIRKKSTGLASIDWPEARDQALCFGWIDGVRRSLGPDSYCIRFTPRRAGSQWSRVNLERFAALAAQGLVTAAGQQVHDVRKERTDHYSYESEPRALADDELARFRDARAAWRYFQASAPSYRKMTLHWVTSAKRAETRARRLATLIEDCAAGRKIRGVDIGRKG